MFIKPCSAIWIITGMLASASAFSNQASTEYVQTAINALRTELSASDNQLINLINQLNSGLGTLSNHTSDAGAILNNKIDLVQNQVNELPIITHKIGDTFQGGVVFYVDATRQHGLIASLSDLETEGIAWRNGEGGDRRVNARAMGVGAGETNTRLIVAEQTVDEQEGRFAALLTTNYQVTESGAPCASVFNPESLCYSGWYLPSAFELTLLYTNLKQSGLSDFGNEAYWSSTEASATEAWLLDFGSGQSAVGDKSTLAHVRAIHNF